jgi:Rrf2 family protein
MLSNTCRYAIRATIYLAIHARKEKKVGIKVISKELDIPSPFLGKILQQLAKHKLLLSTKGPNGGFSLAKPADEITLYDIVDIIDSDDLFKRCLISLRSCGEEKHHCSVHAEYEKIRNDVSTLFKTKTIGQLAEGVENSGDTIVI